LDGFLEASFVAETKGMHLLRLVHFLSLCGLLEVAHEGLRRRGYCLLNLRNLFSEHLSQVFVGGWVR